MTIDCLIILNKKQVRHTSDATHFNLIFLQAAVFGNDTEILSLNK